ncbi:DUF2956 domain-containing protein [Ferrimonas balearica]|uniref:DUF2956 domain-containing protein n=1 Tax=Ferrimonas balearica TaxID=44012 RepID=UPI001C96619B|nr:DUF2956 domain-containing protein [Ferrimonas balearica]MBY6108448.1 DUF2956 domain-containing protein [Ferrimonas balearica]
MAKANTNAQSVSPEVVAEAMKIARGTQQPGQTKEQTKLIAKGIEKGIAEYKKQQKAKARAADKARKQARRAKARDAEEAEEVVMEGAGPASSGRVAWALLVLSWAGFAAYLLLS